MMGGMMPDSGPEGTVLAPWKGEVRRWPRRGSTRTTPGISASRRARTILPRASPSPPGRTRRRRRRRLSGPTRTLHPGPGGSAAGMEPRLPRGTQGPGTPRAQGRPGRAGRGLDNFPGGSRGRRRRPPPGVPRRPGAHAPRRTAPRGVAPGPQPSRPRRPEPGTGDGRGAEAHLYERKELHRRASAGSRTPTSSRCRYWSGRCACSRVTYPT